MIGLGVETENYLNKCLQRIEKEDSLDASILILATCEMMKMNEF